MMNIKEASSGFLSVILLFLSLFLIFWTFPENFFIQHFFSFMGLSVSLLFFYSFIISGLIAHEMIFVQTGLSYLVLMDTSMLFYRGVEHESVAVVWFFMFISFSISFIIFRTLINKKRHAEKDLVTAEIKEKTDEETNEISSFEGASFTFGHPDFDFVLENLENDWHYLEENKDVLDLEDWHHAEKLYCALKKAALHYNQLRAEQRIHAEASIEDLCIRAENYIEMLKQKINDAHLTQIKKLSELHTK